MSGGTSLGGSSSPLTTKGDLYGFSTVNARIPVGTDGFVLTADSAQTLGVKWAAPGAAGTGTDNHITRWDGTSALQDSLLIINDTGQLALTAGTKSATALNHGTTGTGYFGDASILGTAVSGNKITEVNATGFGILVPSDQTKGIQVTESSGTHLTSFLTADGQFFKFASSTAFGGALAISSTGTNGGEWDFYVFASSAGAGTGGGLATVGPANNYSWGCTSLDAFWIGPSQGLKATTLTVQPQANASAIGAGATTTANATTSLTIGAGAYASHLSRILGIGDRIATSAAPGTLATVKTIPTGSTTTVDANLGDGSSQTVNRRRAIQRWDDQAGTPVALLNDQGRLLIGNVSTYGGPQVEADIQGTIRSSVLTAKTVVGSSSVKNLASLAVPTNGLNLVANSAATLGFDWEANFTSFVFRPGGTQAGNVFTSWADLYTALQLTGGLRFIQFDDRLGLVSMPAGTYDLTGVVLSGSFAGGNQVLLELAEDCVWSNLPVLITNGLYVVSTSSNNVWTRSDGSVSFLFLQFNSVIVSAGTGDIFRLSNSSSLSLLLDSASTITSGGSGGHTFDLSGSGVAAFYGLGLGSVQANTIKDDGSGFVLLLWGVGSFDFDDNQPDYSSVVVKQYVDTATNHVYSNGVSTLASDKTKTAIDELASGTFSIQRVVPTTLGSVTISNNKGHVQLVPAGIIAVYGITLPATPYNGQELAFSNGTAGAITALTISPNTGQTATGAPSTLAANAFFRMTYVTADTNWYRSG